MPETRSCGRNPRQLQPERQGETTSDHTISFLFSTRQSTRVSTTSRSLSSGASVPFSTCLAMIIRIASSTGGGRSSAEPQVRVMMRASWAVSAS